MDEQKKQHLEEMKRKLPFRLIAIGFLLYMLGEIVVGYLKGGPEAPSQLLLILSIVVMGGGSALVGWLTWRSWKQAKKAEEEEME